MVSGSRKKQLTSSQLLELTISVGTCRCKEKILKWIIQEQVWRNELISDKTGHCALVNMVISCSTKIGKNLTRCITQSCTAVSNADSDSVLKILLQLYLTTWWRNKLNILCIIKHVSILTPTHRKIKRYKDCWQEKSKSQQLTSAISSWINVFHSCKCGNTH